MFIIPTPEGNRGNNCKTYRQENVVTSSRMFAPICFSNVLPDDDVQIPSPILYKKLAYVAEYLSNLVKRKMYERDMVNFIAYIYLRARSSLGRIRGVTY